MTIGSAAFGLACLCLLALAAIVGPAAAAAAECPNEAFRVGPSAALPECRAYEMVTPADKEGGEGVYIFGQVQAAPSGDGAALMSPSAYAGAQGSSLNNRYIASRANGAWNTINIDGLQAIQDQALVRTTFAVSEDGEWALTASKEAFVPGAVPYGSNLYLRNVRTGQSTLVAALPGDKAFSEWTRIGGSLFVAASTDWSHIVLATKAKLAEGAEENKSNLYEFADGKLTMIGHPGALPAVVASRAFAPNVISVDGSRSFYIEKGVLYMHEDGGPAVAISASEKSGEEGVLKSGSFLGATSDGGIVYFVSSGDLTGQSENKSALYRYEVAAPEGQRLTDLTPNSIITPGSGLSGVSQRQIGMSEDGSFVYFAAAEDLTPDAPVPSGNATNVYVWHGEPGTPGVLRYIAGLESSGPESSGPGQYRVSTNGRYLAMGSNSLLTAAAMPSSACPKPPTEGWPPERCRNVFIYSYDTNDLACVSCTGAPAIGASEIGGWDALLEAYNYVPRSLFDDGTVFFNSPNALVPTDTNGLTDVYEWRQGRVDLLSTGRGDSGSLFGDTDPSGANVFIKTGQQLVGQDVDSVYDVYDARVDGGLASQAAAEPTVSCTGEESCRRATPARSTNALPASAVLGGPGNVSSAKCAAVGRRAARAQRRARALGRRAKHTSGSKARALRRQARHQRALAKHLKKRARNCSGGGR